MTRDLLKDVFGFTDTEVKKIVDGAHEWIEEIVNEAMKNGKTKSYFNTKGCYYNNGELKEKYEKEYVNGELTKDEHYKNELPTKEEATSEPEEKCLTGKCADKKELRQRNLVYRRTLAENKELTKENEALKKQIREMTKYIDGINDEIKKTKLENSRLQSVLDNVKKCF